MGRVVTIDSPQRLSSLALLLLLGGCAGAPSDPPPPFAGPVRVGVLPDRPAESLREHYAPLLAHLASATGLEFELVVPDGYDELLRLFHDDGIDLAWFGGLTLAIAERHSRACPLVTRDVDLEFTSDFLVAASFDGRSVQELGGTTLAFGPKLSTSGHLMPRHHLLKRGIVPEEFFGAVRHADNHEQTATWVQDGEVDVGAVNSLVADSMFRRGRLSAGRVRVLERTPRFRNYAWAVQPDIDPDLRVRLQDAFLALDVSNAEHREILALQNTRGYLPASRADYDELRAAAVELGLLERARR